MFNESTFSLMGSFGHWQGGEGYKRGGGDVRALMKLSLFSNVGRYVLVLSISLLLTHPHPDPPPICKTFCHFVQAKGRYMYLLDVIILYDN